MKNRQEVLKAMKDYIMKIGVDTVGGASLFLIYSRIEKNKTYKDVTWQEMDLWRRRIEANPEKKIEERKTYNEILEILRKLNPDGKKDFISLKPINTNLMIEENVEHISK